MNDLSPDIYSIELIVFVYWRSTSVVVARITFPVLGHLADCSSSVKTSRQHFRAPLLARESSLTSANTVGQTVETPDIAHTESVGPGDF